MIDRWTPRQVSSTWQDQLDDLFNYGYIVDKNFVRFYYNRKDVFIIYSSFNEFELIKIANLLAYIARQLDKNLINTKEANNLIQVFINSADTLFIKGETI